jgi:hypothetical protein
LATKTLKKLGYELKDDEWKLGQTKRALEYRKKRLDKEEEIRKIHEQVLSI